MTITDTSPTTLTPTTFGPDVTIPDPIESKGKETHIASMAFWAEISSTDKDGIVIDGIRKDDLIEIQDISGICSFAQSSNKVLAGFVAIVGGILQDGISYYTDDHMKKTNEAIAEQSKKLQEALSKVSPHKRRDGYGQDPGTDDFGKHEGGLIVCMPPARGALYATEGNYLKDGAKSEGRLPKYFSDNINRMGSFFPCRQPGGRLSAAATMAGTVHLLAFDQNFADNGGAYSVKVLVHRPNPKITAAVSKKMLLQSVRW